MNPKIAIIGGSGNMGKRFADAFTEQDIDVLIGNSKTNNPKIVKDADIIIITVPIRLTDQIIKGIIPSLKPTALLTDFTSVKINPCKSMEKANCSVLGGHPIFGPSVPFKNRPFILCPIKGDSHITWYKTFLKNLGLDIIEMTPDEHDKQIAIIQCLSHLSSLSLSASLEKINCNLEQLNKLASPVYTLRIYSAARILAQDPKLYADIAIENPYSKQYSQMYLQIVKEFNDSIASSNKEAFEKIFIKSKRFFRSLTEDAVKIIDKAFEGISG